MLEQSCWLFNPWPLLTLNNSSCSSWRSSSVMAGGRGEGPTDVTASSPISGTESGCCWWPGRQNKGTFLKWHVVCRIFSFFFPPGMFTCWCLCFTNEQVGRQDVPLEDEEKKGWHKLSFLRCIQTKREGNYSGNEIVYSTKLIQRHGKMWSICPSLHPLRLKYLNSGKRFAWNIKEQRNQFNHSSIKKTYTIF